MPTNPGPRPPGWYPDPDGGPGPRYWDGTVWNAPQPTAQPTSSKNGGKVFGAIGAVLVFWFVYHSIHAGQTSSTSSSSTESTAESTASSAAVVTMGQEARDGKFGFTVTKVDTAKVAVDPTDPDLRTTAKGEFVNVHMTVRNIGHDVFLQQPEAGG